MLVAIVKITLELIVNCVLLTLFTDMWWYNLYVWCPPIGTHFRDIYLNLVGHMNDACDLLTVYMYLQLCTP